MVFNVKLCPSNPDQGQPIKVILISQTALIILVVELAP